MEQPVSTLWERRSSDAEQIEFVAHRGAKHACHSDNVADAEDAQRIQHEYVELQVARRTGASIE